MPGSFSQSIPRPSSSPGRTNFSPSESPATRFHGYTSIHRNTNNEEVGLETNNSAVDQHFEPPAGSLGTTTTEEASSGISLPRNLTVSDLEPRLQASPYIQYVYSALNRQGYSTTNSARTSFTRVDMGVGDNPELQNECDGQAPGENVVQAAEEEQQIQAMPTSPIVLICFLLISGKRKVMTFEPETTIGRVKELIWNTWPSGQEWSDERPPTPSHLRLLHSGKMLQDDDTLKACNFPIHTPVPSAAPPPPTIVHLSVRPAGPGIPSPDTGDLEKKKKGTRTRLVARLSSVVGGDGDSEGHSVPGTGTIADAGAAATAQPDDTAHGCNCCIVC